MAASTRKQPRPLAPTPLGLLNLFIEQIVNERHNFGSLIVAMRKTRVYPLAIQVALLENVIRLRCMFVR